MVAPNPNHGGSDLAAGTPDDRRYFDDHCRMTKEKGKIEKHHVDDIMSDTNVLDSVPGNLLIALLESRPDNGRSSERAMAKSTERSLQLKFLDEVSSPVLTGDKLNGKDGAAIQLVVVDKMTGQLVSSGPEASATVEILMLHTHGDEDEHNLSFKEFNERIIRGRNNGKPYFPTDMYVRLQRGKGILRNVKLGSGDIHVRKCWCRLGARVVDNFSGSMVKEAWTKSFMVRDSRVRYAEKKEAPSLADKIWRLCNIGKGGTIDQRLGGENIYTVEDLLIRLLKDYDWLKETVRLSGKKWDDMVKNARACPSGRTYCHTNSHQNTSVVFNIHGEILGLYLENAAAPMSLQKNKRIASCLFSSAIGHWDEVFEFNDESSLQQHLSSQCIISNEASTEEKDMECIEAPLSIDNVPIMGCMGLGHVPCSNLGPDSNVIFENSMNADAGTEGIGFVLTEPLGKMNLDKSLTFHDASISTSSYFSSNKNTTFPDLVQLIDPDLSSAEYWKAALQYSEGN